ncbi:glucosamine--fructose-6-phosphateaminotransferase (plasmid) [Mesorhizobium loti]|uniref:glutamine--fructose-6-phosphate transaminase (isomerizing) n=1 Tax=Mesorhizobium sp. 131-2-5 TaxID=2744519 RepID=UPI0008199859|nr:glutamine--fructose-6-phosphate transaminase (isomerizing) [Mesorhizobium sp. 131-2-5]BAV52611.1 glucosamine--fructose-6-phosphateaminotransferase [Mesorhizobium loti]BCH05029.1 glutamine--fructose-6-phosphate aminotransferase [isomerizing] [Mesorhizobium sp. 131-2-5]
MCGIVGILGKQAVATKVLQALRRLEYRGYDSAGIATLEGGLLTRRRAEGKLRNLEVRLSMEPLDGLIGIGHTRWATHGKPSETNAHPHATAKLAVVHNGIIENFRELRAELQADGCVFNTETDTEIVAHLVTRELDRGRTPVEAVGASLPLLRGAFALAFLFQGEEDLLIGARKGSPLAVGIGDGEMYLGSDAIALAPFTSLIAYLEEGDWVVLNREGATFYDKANVPVERSAQPVAVGAFLVDKGNHRYFMAKEIYEQPEVVSRTLTQYVDMATGSVRLPIDIDVDWKALTRVSISGCGTAYYAGLTAKYWFEHLARLPVEIDVASEFRYREAPLPENGLALFISQSGETADTLACLRYARQEKQTVLSVVNVATSTIARESHSVAPTLAGPEIGVASTKGFTCQLTVLACLAVAAARSRGMLSKEAATRHVKSLIRLPGLFAKALELEPQIEKLSHTLAKARHALYLGRGTSFPLAMEGALKLKEISYIHAEGYPAGELKHGPIALIDKDMPIIVIAPHDALFEKTASNMQEVAARGGRIILITDSRGAAECGITPETTIIMPDMDSLFASIVYALPIQMIAYHTAAFMGLDVDQPRNLAKSVTVE